MRNILRNMHRSLAGKLRNLLSPFCRSGLFVFLVFLTIYNVSGSSTFGGLSVAADVFCLPLMPALWPCVLAQAHRYRLQLPSSHLPLFPVATGLKRSVLRPSPSAIECKVVRRLSVPLARSNPVPGLLEGTLARS